jgi:hypothetical protein
MIVALAPQAAQLVDAKIETRLLRLQAGQYRWPIAFGTSTEAEGSRQT